MRRTPHSQGRSQRYRTAGPRSLYRRIVLPAPGPSGATPPHSGGSGSFRQRQIRGLHHAAQPDGRRRRRTADLPGHRHGHLHRQEGRECLYGSGRRRMYRPGRLRSLQGAQPALFAGGALHDDRGEELGHEPARTDRSLRRQRQRIQIPVHHQRRRLRQQNLPLPADQSAAEREIASGIFPLETHGSRHLSLPALPPGRLHRRHVGRNVSGDRQEGFGRLPRPAAHLG